MQELNNIITKGYADGLFDNQDVKNYIISVIAVEFGSDKEFLNRINKLTFGLLKQDNLH
jgi:hypothetical protein